MNWPCRLDVSFVTAHSRQGARARKSPFSRPKCPVWGFRPAVEAKSGRPRWGQSGPLGDRLMACANSCRKGPRDQADWLRASCSPRWPSREQYRPGDELHGPLAVPKKLEAGGCLCNLVGPDAPRRVPSHSLTACAFEVLLPQYVVIMRKNMKSSMLYPYGTARRKHLTSSRQLVIPDRGRSGPGVIA